MSAEILAAARARYAGQQLDLAVSIRTGNLLAALGVEVDFQIDADRLLALSPADLLLAGGLPRTLRELSRALDRLEPGLGAAFLSPRPATRPAPPPEALPFTAVVFVEGELSEVRREIRELHPDLREVPHDEALQRLERGADAPLPSGSGLGPDRIVLLADGHDALGRPRFVAVCSERHQHAPLATHPLALALAARHLVLGGATSEVVRFDRAGARPLAPEEAAALSPSAAPEAWAQAVGSAHVQLSLLGLDARGYDDVCSHTSHEGRGLVGVGPPRPARASERCPCPRPCPNRWRRLRACRVHDP